MSSEEPAPETPPGETVYRERRFELRVCDLPLRGGGSERRGVVVHGGSVVILPLVDVDRVVLIRNRRWQIGQTLLELPAGTLDPGEAPEAGAARELIEETGYRAATLEPMPAFYLAPGITNERMHAYVARGLEPVGQALEADEDITVEIVTRAEARRACSDGQVRDAKTLAVLGRWLLGDLAD